VRSPEFTEGAVHQEALAVARAPEMYRVDAQAPAGR
jgi:hypothetical protein